jgi:hypothetical protein
VLGLDALCLLSSSPSLWLTGDEREGKAACSQKKTTADDSFNKEDGTSSHAVDFLQAAKVGGFSRSLSGDASNEKPNFVISL